MDFYTEQHKYYCGIDLHARNMYVCIMDQAGKVVIHKNIKTKPDLFKELISPFIEDVVVAVECVFTWYWLAALNHQYNFASLGSSLKYKYTRENTKEMFSDTSVQRAVDLDTGLIDVYKRELEAVEKFVERTAKHHDYHNTKILQSIPGVGRILVNGDPE